MAMRSTLQPTERESHPLTSQGIQRARELLGSEADALSDDQIVNLARHADLMARAIVEAYCASVSQSQAA